MLSTYVPRHEPAMTTVRSATELSDAEIERQLRHSRRLEDAPEHVIQRALAVWHPRRQAASAPGLVERVRALLTFDSGAASPLAFGMRSTGGTTRQLLFSAGGHDVDLRVSPAGSGHGDHWLLSGQVLGPEASGAVALTDALGQAVAEAQLDELGEFLLPAIAPGQYNVTLNLGVQQIELPSILVPQAI
jgi:hypothetical protein